MSVTELSKLLQKHIVKRVAKAAKAKTSTQGLDITAMRASLSRFSRHDAVISERGLNTLVQQVAELRTGRFDIRHPKTKQYITFSELSKTDQDIVSSAIIKFAQIDLDLFLSSIRYGKNKVQYLDSGVTRYSELEESNSKDTGDRVVKIKNIPQTTLINLLMDYIQKPPINANSKEVSFLKENLQAGHTAGMFTLKMLNTFGLLSPDTSGKFRLSGHSKRNINSEDQERLVEFMNNFIHILTEADRISSNMPDEIEIFQKSLKELGGRHPRASTEIQLAFLNKESGNTLISLGGKIANIAKVASKVGAYDVNVKQPEAVKKLLEGIKSLVDNLQKEYSTRQDTLTRAEQDITKNLSSFTEEYLNTPSSPIYTKSILDSISNTLKSGIGKLSTKKYLTNARTSVKVPKSSKDSSVSTAIAATKTLKAKITSLAKSTKGTSATISTRIKSSETSYIPSLQVLLDSALTEKIKQNMRKPALQNRTGRFAESVKVERLSESRAGMITAFYSYMKSPYQTFEPGYRQGTNARNPKTLIAKSIRDVASQMVGNKLRAVSI